MEHIHFARLIALHPDVIPQEFELKKEVSTIGRLPELCDLCVLQNTVSRVHARIERQGSHYVITNLSRNNTFINGLPIEGQQILKDQDTLGLSTPAPLLRFVDSDQTVFVSRRLQCSAAQHQFVFDDTPMTLTPTQYKLLFYLFQHRGELCEREKCEEFVWGDDPVIEASALHRLAADIRAEFRRIEPTIDPIETRRGLGYVLRWF